MSTLSLVLICLVVKLEIVNGAINYNSVNNYENASYAALDDDSDIVPFLLDDANRLDERPSSRPSVIYQNEFAVFMPGGIERANRIAEKHGFTNMGQVRRTSSSSSFTLSYQPT